MEKIINLMKELHKDIYRKDGITPYYEHPLAVYNKLISWGINNNSLSKYYLIPALFHDVFEENPKEKWKNIEEILKKEFDNFIINLIKRLTFIPDKNNKYAKTGYLISCTENNYTLIIKIADRICNVNDFIKDGNLKYAKIYFHKADCLYNKIYEYMTNEKDNIIYKNIWNDLNNLEEKLK